VIDDVDVIRFLERDGPLFVALIISVLGVVSIARSFRSYKDDHERMGTYLSGILTTWLLLAVFFAYLYWARVVVADKPWDATLLQLGLTYPITHDAFVFWTGSLVLMWAGIAWLFTVVQRALGLSPTQARLQIQPRTPRETIVWSLLLAPTAGICEEIVFRGYFVSQLLRTQDEWVAIAVSSLLFGLLHIPQGVLGVLAIGLMGATAAYMFVTTGSIWPAIVTHTLYNMAVPFLFDYRTLDNQKAA
jgi:membrane protease YdiL (CAAX protease family)